MDHVFIVQHIHLIDELEDIKIIGIYSSEKKAKLAIKRFSIMPGFRDSIDGFHIDKYKLDADNWVEGYVTVTVQ